MLHLRKLLARDGWQVVGIVHLEDLVHDLAAAELRRVARYVYVLDKDRTEKDDEQVFVSRYLCGCVSLMV